MTDLAIRNKNYQQKFRDKKKAEAMRIKTLVESRYLEHSAKATRGYSIIEKVKRSMNKLEQFEGQISIKGGKESELIDDLEYLLILLRQYENDHVKTRFYNPLGARAKL